MEVPCHHAEPSISTRSDSERFGLLGFAPSQAARGSTEAIAVGRTSNTWRRLDTHAEFTKGLGNRPTSGRSGGGEMVEGTE